MKVNLLAANAFFALNRRAASAATLRANAESEVNEADSAFDARRSLLTGPSAIYTTEKAMYLKSGHTYPKEDHCVAIGDVNNDGFNDIVVGNNDRNHLFLNDGHGKFPFEPTLLPGGIEDTRGVAIGDFNGDGYGDIFVANFEGPQQLLLNDQAGSFSVQTVVPHDDYKKARDVHALDVNGDGNLDVVISESSRNYPSYYLLGDGSGNLRTRIYLPDTYDSAVRAASADFDDNGMMDLVMINNDDNSGINIFLNGGGESPAFTKYNIPFWGRHHDRLDTGIVTGDVNGDGLPDIVAVSAVEKRVFINNGTIDGVPKFTHEDLLPFGVVADCHAVDLADVNYDGYLDIAIARYGGQNMLLLNNGQGGFDEADMSFLPQESGQELTGDIKFGNLDGNTSPDLVTASKFQQRKTVLLNSLLPPSPKYELRNDTGSKCPVGLELTKDECKAARVELGLGYVYDDFISHDWNYTPCDCFLWKDDIVKYNSGAAGCERYTEAKGLVCKKSKYELRTDIKGPKCPVGMGLTEDECRAAGDELLLGHDTFVASNWDYTPCDCFLFGTNLDYDRGEKGCQPYDARTVGLVCKKAESKYEFRTDLTGPTCPDGLSLTNEECKAAGVELGLGIDAFVSHNWNYTPCNCFVWGGGDLKYNPGDAGCKSDDRTEGLVCKKPFMT